MTRAEFKENLRNELSGMTAQELKMYAKEHYIKLYTVVPDRMVSAIVESMANRMFHGDAFRTNPKGGETV